MPEELEIRISSTSKQASADLARVEGQVKGLGKSTAGPTGPTAAFNSLKTGISGAAAAGTVFVGAAVGIVAAVKGLADHTLEYALQVQSLVREIGTTPEAASKLIQAADDMGVSFDALKQGLRFAISQGIEPTIENILDLSDEMLKLPEGAERTEFAMEKFGRKAGPELAKLLGQGRDEIEAMFDSIEGTARLMDTEALQAAEEYRRNLDDLGDTFEDLKVAAGRAIIPVLNDLATNIKENIDQSHELTKVSDDLVIALKFEEEATRALIDEWGRGLMTNQEFEIALFNLTFAYKDATVATEELFAAQMEQHVESYEAAKASEELKKAVQAEGEAVEEANEKTRAWIDTLDPGVGNAIKRAIDALEFSRLGGENIQKAFAAVNQALEDHKITKPQADAFYKELWVASQALEVSLGTLTFEDAAQNLSDALNVPLATAEELINRVLSADRKTVNMQAVVTVIYKIQGGGVPPGLGGGKNKNVIPFQHGVNFVVPPGYPNDSFVIPMGLTSGERLIVIPREKQTANNYNLTIHTSAPYEPMVDDFDMMRAWGG